MILYTAIIYTCIHSICTCTMYKLTCIINVHVHVCTCTCYIHVHVHVYTYVCYVYNVHVLMYAISTQCIYYIMLSKPHIIHTCTCTCTCTYPRFQCTGPFPPLVCVSMYTCIYTQHHTHITCTCIDTVCTYIVHMYMSHN